MKSTLEPAIFYWINQNNLKNSKGEPFEWSKHTFLKEPLMDMHPIQGVNKSAQVGWSETMIAKSLYLAKEKKMNIIYALPHYQFLERFVPPKVNPIIEYNPIFADVSGGIGLKQISFKDSDGLQKKRYIYFMGTFNSKSKAQQEESSTAVSITADLVISDEASRSDQFVLSQLVSRTENSDYRGRWYFDNPTYPNRGSDYIFQRSDKKYWIIKCRRCNYRQYLDWFRLDKYPWEKGTNHCFIDTERKLYICGGCGKSINEGEILLGEWVPMKPSITEFRGYWLNQLCYVQHNVTDILQKEEDPKMPKSVFYNFVLGKPYVGSDVRVSRENLINNITGDINKLKGNTMGVDQGNIKWFVIGNEQGIFLKGHTQDWREIEQLHNKYNCVTICDALPFQAEPKNLEEKYHGKFFRAFYKPESDQAEIAQFKDNGTVLIRREEAFDMIVDKIMQRKLPINIKQAELEDFIKHWSSLIRIVEEDKLGNNRFYWERIDDDHLAHATLYQQMALLRASSEGSEVMTYKKQGNNLIENVNPNLPSLDDFIDAL